MSVGGGLLVGFITRNSINVYDTLKKSLLTPSNGIFQIVWIVLYTLIGIAAYRIYMNNKAEKKRL